MSAFAAYAAGLNLFPFSLTAPSRVRCRVAPVFRRGPSHDASISGGGTPGAASSAVSLVNLRAAHLSVPALAGNVRGLVAF